MLFEPCVNAHTHTCGVQEFYVLKKEVCLQNFNSQFVPKKFVTHGLVFHDVSRDRILFVKEDISGSCRRHGSIGTVFKILIK
jgi:hypothetical protein